MSDWIVFQLPGDIAHCFQGVPGYLNINVPVVAETAVKSVDRLSVAQEKNVVGDFSDMRI
jgi:hypothetical protein